MFEKYYGLYMKNMVSLTSLDKLVDAGKLTKEQVDNIVYDRMEKYGY